MYVRGGTNLLVLDPPFELRKRERPKKNKRKEFILVIPPKGRKRYSSGTKRCKTCKQLGHNKAPYGKRRNDKGRVPEKYKRKQSQKKPNQVGRPRKI